MVINMGYRELEIAKCYETTNNKTELLDKFYIPMLEQTTTYLRIAGYFSSTSLAIASKGIEGLVKNNGKMRLLISPELSEQDYQTIISSKSNKLSESMDMFSSFDINNFSSNDNLSLLAWMLDNNLLEIKIVIDKNSKTSIFHQKVGIGFDEEGNMLSFSGSINETAQAWLSNIEEFKTFKSWEPEQLDYLMNDLKKFNAYWNNERKDISIVYDLPDSIKDKIISVKPRDIYDLEIMRRYTKKKSNENKDLSLFPHQEKAVEMWFQNEKSLLFEMATGTGKTRTAIGCALKILKETNKLIVIVATPQNTLSRQWEGEIISLKIPFDRKKIVDGSNAKWKQDLESTFLDVSLGYINNAILFTTHDTASSKKFIDIVQKNKLGVKILFICDEVHAIGSDKQRFALLKEYDYRVGLSATPDRLYDDGGTKVIKDYFGNKSFEFTIADALNTINPITKKPFLNQFYYYPIFIELSEEELGKYKHYSKQLASLKEDDEADQEKINRILNFRAEIVKNASAKMQAVIEIIDNLEKEGRIQNTIIFATDKQIIPLMNMLSERGITRCKITENESASKIVGIDGLNEREEIIKQFKKGEIQVLTGIKCLDEGIDIKNARIAILMASSTNPREYVQRVGRVIRVDENKKESIIFDIIVGPLDNSPTEIRILEKEARRALSIAKNATNFIDVISMFNKKGVETSCLLAKK